MLKLTLVQYVADVTVSWCSCDDGIPPCLIARFLSRMPIFIISVLGVPLPFAIDSEKAGSLGSRFRLLAILSMFLSHALAFKAKKASGFDQNVGKIANSQKLVSREPLLSHA